MNSRIRLGALACVLAVAGCSSSVPAPGATPTTQNGPARADTSTTCLVVPASTIPGAPFESEVGCSDGSGSYVSPPPGTKCAYEASGSVNCSAPPTTMTGENDSTSASWADVGNDRGNPPPPSFPAVLTDPVDVLTPGTYTFTGGPVPNGSDASVASVSLPPDAGRMLTIRRVSPPAITTSGTESVVTFTVEVGAVSTPYHGLRAWVL